MKRLFVLFGMILVFPMAGFPQDGKVADILDHYFKANGTGKLLNVQTVIMTGTLVQQDAMPLKIVKKRPDKFLMEFDVQDITAYQVYDGKTGWMTAPWTGNPNPQAMTEDRVKDIRNKADFDGLLFNWKAKGHKAELAGMDSIGKSPVYKIKLTRLDGGIEYYFIDQASYMLQKRLSFRMMRGKEAQVENFYRDNRAVEGIIFPFTIDTFIDGQKYSSNQFESIELNKPVDDNIFVMPAK